MINDIQPVHVEKVGIAAPFENRLLGGVVFREVELGHLDG